MPVDSALEVTCEPLRIGRTGNCGERFWLSRPPAASPSCNISAERVVSLDRPSITFPPIQARRNGVWHAHLAAVKATAEYPVPTHASRPRRSAADRRGPHWRGRLSNVHSVDATHPDAVPHRGRWRQLDPSTYPPAVTPSTSQTRGRRSRAAIKDGERTAAAAPESSPPNNRWVASELSGPTPDARRAARATVDNAALADGQRPDHVQGKRVDSGKTDAAIRPIALQDWAAALLRRRKVAQAPNDLDAVFVTRNGSWHYPTKIQGRLRHIRLLEDCADLTVLQGVTPHSFRRTVATEIDEVSDAEATKNRFGHTSKTVTERRYINRTLVVPGYRAATERLAPGSGPGHGAEPVTGDSALSHAWLRQGCPSARWGTLCTKQPKASPKGATSRIGGGHITAGQSRFSQVAPRIRRGASSGRSKRFGS
jgi:hypothetical protein